MIKKISSKRPDWLWKDDCPFEWDAFYQKGQVIEVREYIECLENENKKLSLKLGEINNDMDGG